MNSVGIATLLTIIANTSVALDQLLGSTYERTTAIPTDETWLAGDAQVVGFDRRDSNIGYLVVRYSYTILYRLPDSTNTATYLNGTMQTDQQFLMDPDSYRVAGVYDVFENPELTLMERIGNVMEYTVSVQLTIVP